MAEDRDAVLARLEKARAARLAPADEHKWACTAEACKYHQSITLYISSKEVYCKCGRRMKEVLPSE